MTKPKPQYAGRRATVSEKQAAADAARAEDAARLGKIYGSLLPDVLFLQKRGYAVTREGKAYLVGNKTLDREGVIAMAARERRLAGVPDPSTVRKVATTATDLKVGDSVSIDKAKRSAAGSRPLSEVKEKLSGAALRAKAAAEATSTDLGLPPRMEWVPLDQLTVDRRYQRDMGKANWAHANRILREWNWLHYQPIVVAPAAPTSSGGGGLRGH